MRTTAETSSAAIAKARCSSGSGASPAYSATPYPLQAISTETIEIVKEKKYAEVATIQIMYIAYAPAEVPPVK